MALALKALPAEVLLPKDVVKRDTALALLEAAPRSRLSGRRRLTFDQATELTKAIRLGDACVLTQAADALIAAEIREGFPTLAMFASDAHALSARMADVLEEDEPFRRTRSAIDTEFQRAYGEAFDRAPDDPEVGTQLFLRKEAALIRARVERLEHHLRPALARLRKAGIGDPRPQTSSHSLRT